MIRFLKILALIIVIGFLGWGLFGLEKQSHGLEIKVNSLENNAETINRENQKLKENLEYFSNLENLLKEAKSLFNYHRPGENLIKIIPNKIQNENH